jgi:hypothetical protein
MSDYLFARGRQLEDLFFRKEDARLVQARKELERMEKAFAGAPG